MLGQSLADLDDPVLYLLDIAAGRIELQNPFERGSEP